MAQKSTLKTWIFLLIALITPVAGWFIANQRGFDGLYGQDAFAYYNYAVSDLRQQLFPPPPFFWPPGYPLLVLIASVFVGVTPFAGQLVSLIAGGITTLFTMQIADEFSPNLIVPITAGIVMGLAGQLWQSSIVIMADTVSLAAGTLGVWALIRYARDSKSPFWLALAGGALAYAVITRWIYAVLAVVCAVYALVLLYRISRDSWKTALTHTLWAAVVTGIVLGPVLLAAVFSPPNLQTTYGGNFQYQLVRWDLLNAFRRSFENPDGFQSFPLVNGIYYASLPARLFYLTPILAPAALIGLFVIVRRKQLFRFLPVLAWGAAVYVLLIGGPQQNVRFALTYMPPIAILIGIGIGVLWDWFKSVKILFIVVLAGVFIWQGISAVDYTQEFIDRNQAMLAVVRWTEAQLPSESQLITLGPTLMFRQYTPITTHEIYYLTDTELAQITATDQPTYLLLDVYNVETQWQGRTPSVNYHWLLDHTTLDEIGKAGGYTLFEVEAR